MEEDEEIARAIRRDPRWLVRFTLALLLTVLAGSLVMLWFGRQRVGERVARGFATVTEAPPPDGGPR